MQNGDSRCCSKPNVGLHHCFKLKSMMHVDHNYAVCTGKSYAALTFTGNGVDQPCVWHKLMSFFCWIMKYKWLLLICTHNYFYWNLTRQFEQQLKQQWSTWSRIVCIHFNVKRRDGYCLFLEKKTKWKLYAMPLEETSSQAESSIHTSTKIQNSEKKL